MINVASICMNSTKSVSENIANAFNLIENAVSEGASWVVLPEMFSYMGPYKDLFKNAESETSENIEKFKALALKHKITIFLGTVPEKSSKSSQKVYNTLFVISKEGKIISKYRKTHLFNLNGPTTDTSYKESDGYLPGDKFETVEIDGLKVHLSICYDIRFSSMFDCLQRRAKADVIVCPSAFTETTGKRHWHMLMQSRAVEYQCYVIASSQTGIKENGKENYGHAIAIDPMGNVLADTKKDEGFVICAISKNTISKTRKSLPIIENRRTDLYTK